jgi:hypothetical protein
MSRGLGCLPDPEDARDLPLAARLGAIARSAPPSSATVVHTDVRPKDQGGTNSCTGQACAQGLRLSYLAAGLACPDLSALDPYYRSRAEWGGQRVDEGSYLRTTVKAVQHAGCSTEDAWPFSAQVVNRRPSWAAARSAFDRRGLRGYYRCFSPDDVRRAIAARYAVIGGWDVDEAFLDHGGRGVIEPPRGEIVGAHAVVIPDFAADGTFGLLNSWGPFWGRDGWARVSEEWIARGRDVWALAVWQ